jgi:hypothetical protein
VELKVFTVDVANAMKVADAANPKRAGGSITAVMVQKAGAALGFATPSEDANCRLAPASLANDFITAQVLPLETFGTSEPIAVLAAATNRYQPGQCAVKTSGQLVHSIPIQPDVRS